MFKFGFDETASDVPEWYAEVRRQIERDSFDEAARLAKEAARKCKDADDKSGELRASLAYMNALLASDDVWNARRIGEQSLDLAHELQDKFLEGAAMHMMAKVMLKDPQERRIASMLGDIAVTFSELCAKQADKNMTEAQHKDSWQQMPPAPSFFAQQASSIFADADLKLGEASVMITNSRIVEAEAHRMARSAERQRKSEKSEEAQRIAEEAVAQKLADAQGMAEKAVAEFQELGSPEGEAAAQFVLYQIQVRKDDSDNAAMDALEAIVQCFRNSSNASASLGVAFLLMAELQLVRGDLHDAVSRAAEAAQHFHEAYDGNNKGHAVMAMAKSFLEAEQLDDTMEAASAAVELFKAVRNKTGQAQALAMIAECCAGTGKAPEAVYRLEEAAFLYRQCKDKKKEAIALNTLSRLQDGMVEKGTGPAISEPLRHARRAVQLFEEAWSGETLGAAQANYTVAKALLQQKDFEEAVNYAETSRAVYEKLGDKSGEANASIVLAQIHYEEKDKDKGFKLSQRSLELAGEIGDTALLAVATNLVTNEGKKKEQSLVEHTDMDIIYQKVRLARFDEFEGRRARYKDVGGASEAAALKDTSEIAKPGLGDIQQSQKVQYVIRWQLVANLNLAAMPYPPEVRSK
jgi:tetratricopeptide (TPR) repeat protein